MTRIKQQVIVIYFCILFLNIDIRGEERDPFLSPFEPRKAMPKKPVEEVEIPKPVEQEIKTTLLEAKFTTEIKKYLNTNQPEKADALLADLRKSVADKELSEYDKTQLADFEDQIKNFSKYKELIKATKALMTIDGKILLKDKKNILLINSHPVSEGEDLMELLKLENSVYLDQIVEDSFSLRYKDIKISFPLE